MRVREARTEGTEGSADVLIQLDGALPKSIFYARIRNRESSEMSCPLLVDLNRPARPALRTLPLHGVFLCRHRNRSDKAHSALANRSREIASASS